MICDLCKKEIDTKRERYVHVEDWDCEEMIKEIWCHLICFNQANNTQQQRILNQAEQMIGMTSGIFKQMGLTPEKHYEIGGKK